MGQLSFFDTDKRLAALSEATRLKPLPGWCHGRAFAEILRPQC